MPKYLERMLVEEKDLKGKIKRAEEAVNNPPFDMTKEEIGLLAKQVLSMKEYLSILEQRIEIAKNKRS